MKKQWGMRIFAVMLFMMPLANKNKPPARAFDLIRATEIRRDLDFLASDSLKGRNTPSPELKIAAKYIAHQFEESGLQPVKGSYFQPFKVSRVRLGKENSLTISKNGQAVSYRIKRDFMPYDMTASASVDAPLVFAGYGITAPEYHYDDYDGLDVKGKVV
ncbi:MAG: peptidase M28, partial [Calditrichaeota bacterium]